MGLINLRTNLKDLKFGNDEYKGGSSGQPFIQTRIPATDEPLQTSFSLTGNNLTQGLGTVAASAGAGALIGSIAGPAGTIAGAAAGLGIGIAGAVSTQDFNVSLKIPVAGTGGTDFLLRGGTLLPGIIANDEERLFKFFKSTNGVLFTVKQNLLSRMGTRAQGTTGLLNERIYTPTSTLLGAVGTPFGLHVNKQGLNPLLGVGDPFTPDRYFSEIASNINEINQNPGSDAITHNKLYGLYAVKLLGDKLVPFYRRNGITNNASTDLLAYQGGPGSFLGVGQTRIAYATDNTGAPLRTTNNARPNTRDFSFNVKYATLSYPEIDEVTREVIDYRYPKPIDFREKLRQNLEDSTILSKSPFYDPGKNKTLEARVNLGDPGNNSGKNIISYTNGYTGDAATSFGAASPNSYDKINALPLYKSENPISDKKGNLDLVNFYIQVLDNDAPTSKEFIHFRAFLNQINDTYSSIWSDTKYIGRGEKFYTYSGFDRKVSLSWTVAAQSRAEMKSMYNKLNFLASVCAPDYSKAGYMRGNLVQLTIGDLFSNQVGIITGFSYEMNDDNSTWEIGIDDDGAIDGSIGILPHLVKINSFEFIPIHNFVPRKQQNEYLDDKGLPNPYGVERYIASNTVYYEPSYTSVPNNPFNKAAGTSTVSVPNKQDSALYNLSGLPLNQ